MSKEPENTVYFYAQTDAYSEFSNFAPYGVALEDRWWRTVEHYFQAMKFIETNPEHAELIRQATHPKQARKLGRQKRKGLRKDWAKVKRVVMTRGVYTKCRTYSEVAEALLQTGDAKIFEASQYDYYWGCGRDRRAENMYGQVLMDVRAKLVSEQENTD